MLQRLFERTGCHIARDPGALDKLVKLEQLTEEQGCTVFIIEVHIPHTIPTQPGVRERVSRREGRLVALATSLPPCLSTAPWLRNRVHFEIA